MEGRRGNPAVIQSEIDFLIWIHDLKNISEIASLRSQ
jgi:hypothetical protein